MASFELQEKANFARLSRLLVDKGTDALRKIFDGIHSPASLPTVITANRTSLLKLKPRVINDFQWDLLYPPSGNPPDSKTFDVTLLTVLFRNICGLPKTGWGAMPVDTDRSVQANIVRIKSLRNEVYAHVTSTRVDNATFESLWQKIAQALVELNIPQKDVDDSKTCPLWPEEEIYVEILKDWRLQDEECMKVLVSIESRINRLTEITEERREEKRSNENDEDLLRKLAKHNFKSKIRGKVKFLLPGTREWLLKDVDDWFVGNDHQSRIFLLTAGPGFGKSVFAAKVCENFNKKGKLAAWHFCDFSDSNLRNPMMMLQSLASQMCENVAGFKEKLLDQLKRPHEIHTLKDAFGIYLQNPLDELEVEEPSLIVIDALDESAADDKNEIVNLIADYFSDLPEFIKFLVTSRPDISIAKLTGFPKINIGNNDAKNNSDLEIYLKTCLPRLPDKQADSNSGLFETLVKMCEGSFLYAFYVQSELQKRDDLDKVTCHEIIKFVPKGLDSIYQAYFRRLEDELTAIKRGNLDVLRVLEMLVASEGPLPITFVAQALGLAPDCRETKTIISKVNETVSCLLYVSDNMVAVFHKSVIDWLLARGYKGHEYSVTIDDGIRSLWLICEQVFEKIKKTVCSGNNLKFTNEVKYALRHGLQHLVACNMKERFYWLVDVVIIHLLLPIVHDKLEAIMLILRLWKDVLRGDTVISDELRTRISWHIFEIESIRRSTSLSVTELSFCYLQSVLTYSPKGYLSNIEKKNVESILSKAPRFVEFNFDHEVEVIPLALWSPISTETIKAVGVSNHKTMTAVAQKNGGIFIVSVPILVELWQYLTEYESISCCTFAPDDSFVLFGKLEVALNIAERKEVPFFHRNKETFVSCAFSSNGRRLVTSNGSTIIKLWDVDRQNLMSLLCAGVPVNWCSFSNTGLFIIGDRKYVEEDRDAENFDAEESFCVWNAITLQRSDERKLHELKLNEGKAFQSKLCKRCFRPGFERLNSYKSLEIEPCKPSKSSEIPFKNWCSGTYNGVECSFVLGQQSLSVIENTHFTTITVWDFLVEDPYKLFRKSYKKITAIEDDLWLFTDENELIIVIRTSAPTQGQSSCLPRPTRVLWSSFSPDGFRLATCTSDGCINIWNVDTSQVEQRFKCSQILSPFACWWSEKFLFVFDHFFDRIPNLLKYPVDVNLKIMFSQSQQVSLCHLVDEFLSLSAVVDFSEGFLSFECGKTRPVKVLEVGVRETRMVTLPGIEPMMSIAISPRSTFVFGGGKYKFYIWKRNAEEAAVYKVFFTHHPSILSRFKHNFVSCFSNDSKVVVVAYKPFGSLLLHSEIIDLNTGNHKSVLSSYSDLNSKLFCINMDRVVIAASGHILRFFDMDSGALLGSFFQRYLTKDLIMQTKLSPNGTTIAFPKINGDMEFLRLSIPQNPLLSSIKRKAADEWDNHRPNFERSMLMYV